MTEQAPPPRKKGGGASKWAALTKDAHAADSFVR